MTDWLWLIAVWLLGLICIYITGRDIRRDYKNITHKPKRDKIIK